MYDSEYYQSGNYADYLQRLDKYRLLALEVKDLLKEPVLDFGCGVGFLVHALKSLGVQAQGYDISSWAVQYGKKTLGLGESITERWNDRIPCKTLVALDVFEHMTLEDVLGVIDQVKPKIMLVRMPVTNREGGDFVLEASRNDKSHITCFTKDQWNRAFNSRRLRCGAVLSYKTIWESEGVLSRLYVED